MSPTDRPPPPDESGERGEPSVGNILGFSLLFRERKALLALQRRGLAPGVRLRDYEAEIPGVSFPLEGPLKATNFRHRRCVATNATLSFERRALGPWLRARLCGAPLAGLVVDEVDLEFQRASLAGDSSLPSLRLEAHAPDGRFVGLVFALDIEADGRQVRVRRLRTWHFGSGEAEPDAVFEALVQKLGPEVQPDGDGAALVDASRLALARAFASAGWKAPDLRELGVEQLEFARRGLTVKFAAGARAPQPSNGHDTEDPIGHALARARTLLADEETLPQGLDVLEQVTGAVEEFPGAQLAAIRWRVDVTRFREPAECLAAVREWLSLAPNAPAARRLSTALMAQAGEFTELARILAADCRRPHPLEMQARLELALATLLVDKLDDPRSALAIVGPLVARIRSEPSVRSLLAPALVVLAQARVSDATRDGPRRAPHAIAALDEALEMTDEPVVRASMRARVARRLAVRGNQAFALELVLRAIEEDGDDDEQLELAIELALDIDEADCAIELLEIRVERASGADAVGLRHQLLAVYVAQPGSRYLGSARTQIAAALDSDPEDAAVLRLATTVELRDDAPMIAAEFLARLADTFPSGLPRARVEVERARLLREQGSLDQAWDGLRAPLEDVFGDAPSDQEGTAAYLDALELGLDLAPPSARPELLDRLIETATGPRRAQALIERAAQAIEVDAKLNDLWMAVGEMERPATVLAQISELLEDEDVQGLLELADAAETQNDTKTEVSARARAGHWLSSSGDAARAIVQFGRALELEPYRVDLQFALGQGLDALGRAQDALRYFLPILEKGQATEAGTDPIDLGLRSALLLVHREDDEGAASQLEAIHGELPIDDLRREEIEELWFSVLFRLGESSRARDLARAAASSGSGEQRAGWLVRAAQLSEPSAGIDLLRQATRLRPHDDEVCAGLEAALLAAGRRAELEKHLQSRLARIDSPDKRVRILERLTSCIEGDPAPQERRQELVHCYEELLRFHPEHVDARYALGQLWMQSEQPERARAIWAELPDQMQADDPRVFEPALALAHEAAEHHDLARARALLAPALTVRPGDEDALLLLRSVAKRLPDPPLMLEAAKGLLALAESPSERAKYELECAEAHVAMDDINAAFERLGRASASAVARSALQMQVAEIWLELANKAQSASEQANARAQMRRALGPDLPVEDLLAEVRLLADELGRLPEAFLLLEVGLSEYDADPRVIATLNRLAEKTDQSAQSATILRSVLENAGPGAAKDRMAVALAVIADERDEAAAILFALDCLSDGAAADEGLLDLRARTVHSVGRVEEEIAAVDAGLRTHPTPLLLARLGRALPDADTTTTLASHLVDLSVQAEPQAAVWLADAAIERMSRDADPAPLMRLVETLSEHGSLRPEHWERLESAVERELDSASIARLVALSHRVSEVLPAISTTHVDQILDHALIRMPMTPQLHEALLDRLRHEVETGQPLDASHPAVRRLQRVAHEGAIDNERLVGLWTTHSRLHPNTRAARLLRDRACDTATAGPVRDGFIAELWGRRFWGALVDVLVHVSCEDPQLWMDLASAAVDDTDVRSEGRARGHAGLALCQAGRDEEAVFQLTRSLDIDRDDTALHYALGMSLERLGRPREAIAHLLPLAVREEPGLEDVDLAGLAHRCGRLLVEVGDLHRAVEMLSVARTRSDDRGMRLEVAQSLFEALVGLGKTADATRLCVETAAELPGEDALPWLRRATEHASGRERLDLLERASGLAPRDEALQANIETALRELDDRPALEAFLRRRAQQDEVRGKPGSEAIPTLMRLIDLLSDERHTGTHEAEVLAAWERVLALDSDHVQALLSVAEIHRANQRTREASLAWKHAGTLLPHEDLRFFEPALALCDAAAQVDDLEQARVYLERALDIRPHDPAALGILRGLAPRLGDPSLSLLAAQRLLAHADSPARGAQLEVEAAHAHEALGDDVQALASLAHAAELSEPGSAEHIEIAEHWLRVARKLDAPAQQRLEEARARAQLRRALGSELPASDLLAEVTLLADGLERLEAAIVLLEESLVAHPQDRELLSRLEELCSRSGAGDRLIRALRTVVDALSRGGPRDRLAGLLAGSARELLAARTVLYALDCMTPAAAGRADNLDLRGWAVRKLGKVGDELEALDRQLASDARDPILVERIWRMLDSDARGCAERLLGIAESVEDAAGATWLVRQAVDLLSRHESAELTLGTRALAMLVDRGQGAAEAWTALERTALGQHHDGPAPPELVSLIEIAQKGESSGIREFNGRADRLLDKALARFPDHVPLHTLLRERVVGDGPGMESVLARLEAIARVHGLDDRLRSHLFFGLAGSLPPEEGVDLLRRQAIARIDERATFAHLLNALRSREAWAAVADLLEALDHRDGTDPDTWIALAESAVDHPEIQARARATAGRKLYERGDDRAVEQLQQAITGETSDFAVADTLARALEREGAHARALEQLMPQISGVSSADVDLALALRCGALARKAGMPERAAELFGIVFERTHEPAGRLEIADALLESLIEAGETEHAGRIALACSELTEDPREQARWLIRAADSSSSPREAELLDRAFELTPHDPELAERLEATLLVRGDDEARERLLRRRFRLLGHVGVSDHPDAIGIAERLLGLVDERRLDDRIELLEFLINAQPDHIEARLIMGEIRREAGDTQGASTHWRRLLETLPAQDPRCFGPARELGAWTLGNGEFAAAQQWLEHASRLRPNDASTLSLLLDAGVGNDDQALVVRCADSLLANPSSPREAAELHARAADALEQLGEFSRALGRFQAAATAAAEGGAEHKAIAEKWLRLATSGQLEESAAPVQEALAREEQRRGYGGKYPARLRIAHASLLAGLQRVDDAVELLREGILAAPSDESLAAALETLAVDARSGSLVVQVLDTCLGGIPKDDATRVSVAARLARVAREAGEAAIALRAVEVGYDGGDPSPDQLDIREWAVRTLNQVGGELARIDEQLLERPSASRIARLRRMLDEDGAASVDRLLELCARATPDVARELARAALDIARSACGERLDLSIRSFRAAHRHGASELISQHWAAVEQLAIQVSDVDALLELLRIAEDRADGSPETNSTVEALLGACTRLRPGHPAVDAILWGRAKAADGSTSEGYIAGLDALADQAELEGRARAQLFSGASQRLEQALVVETLLSRARETEDEEVRAGFVEQLWELRAWDALLQLANERKPKPVLVDFLAIADAATDVPEIEARARAAAAGVFEELEELDETLGQLQRAFELEPKAALALRLGRALDQAERPGAALEHYVRILDSEELPTLDVVPAALASRAAELFLSSDDVRSAAAYYERAQGLATDEKQALPAAERAFELLEELGETERAGALATKWASTSDPGVRDEWLRRAARYAESDARIEFLEAADSLRPEDDAIGDELEDALSRAGDKQRLEAVLVQRLQTALEEGPDSPAHIDRALDIVYRLLPILEHQSGREDRIAELYATILTLEPDNVPALLALAELQEEAGDRGSALKAWKRAGDLMPHDDDGFFEPALQIAKSQLEENEPQAARMMLERALETRPGDRAAQELLHASARRLSDPALTLRAATGLLAFDPPNASRLELEIARANHDLGDSAAALSALSRARSHVATASEQHQELASLWLEVALGADPETPEAERLEREATAREQRRQALGDALPAPELRSEVNLLVRLERTDVALDLVASRLSERADDELLLSTLKDLCVAADVRARYIDALELAVETTADPARKERLAIELAYSAVELEDAEKLLATLDRLAPERSDDPELLDLREWAVRSLGRVEDELSTLDKQLLAEPDSDALVARMFRMLDEDADACLARLAKLAREAPTATQLSLAENGLRLADSMEVRQIASPLDLGRILIAAGAASAITRHWPRLAELTITKGDAENAAAMLALGRDAIAAGENALAEHHGDFMARAIVCFDGAPPIMAELWQSTADEGGRPDLTQAVARVRQVAWHHEVTGRPLATIWAGLAAMLERPVAALTLHERASELVSSDSEAFDGLVEELEQRNHWPEVMRLLEQRIATVGDDVPLRVAALKRLAHICADIIGDAGAAIRHLERAIEDDPEDPDLLLPLLDHHYTRSDLGRVIELSIRVMEHVPMGDAAFVALGHRAADAALAHGDHRFAESLLRRVAARCPDDNKTRARLAELEALADDPEHRCRMLHVIASRQAGSARIEALEERARLLIEPLGRVEDAIADLELVLSESPERRDSETMLARLYEQRERWPDLAALLERSFARQAGLSRSRSLRRLAMVYRDHLHDLGKAEETLRLALETLGGTPDERALADEIQLEFVEVLERQGRYSELVVHLRAELADELADELIADSASQRRVELLGALARMLRDYLDDETESARVYERLEKVGRLPDDGLATLARGYRNQHRHADLVRVPIARSEALGETGDVERKAEIDQRIGDLLEGPLRRPHEAARFYLAAYLANPMENTIAGQRARVLLAGTDSVVNVRKLLLDRIQHTREAHYPLGLALLGDLLAPHEEHEEEAETRYRMALKMSPTLAGALEGLGRLLARQGRLAESVDPLVRAAKSLDIDSERAADDAATAARALQELEREDEAEAVLKYALGRAPDAQRCLLELARLYGRQHRPDDEAHALDELSALSLSSMLRAEVAFRRAMLLEKDFRAEPFSEAGELARAYLLEAVGSDAMHAQARQVLQELATARSEWSIVAHMLFLAIRELPPGTQRALTHLDMATVYLERLSDAESAMRNLASALKQPTEDSVVSRRASALALALPDPALAASKLEKTAETEVDIDDATRARLYLASAELHRQAGANAAAQRASQVVMELSEAHPAATETARQQLENLSEGDSELQREREALATLLESEDQAIERLHILGRLREIGRALSDATLVERASTAQLSLAHELLDSDADRDEAAAALLELFADRGDYGKIVELYEDLANRTNDPIRAAKMLTDASRFAWNGQRDAGLAIAIVRRALSRRPDDSDAMSLLVEIATASDDPTADEAIYSELSQIEEGARPPALSLRIAAAALRLGHDEEGRKLVFRLLQSSLTPELRLTALGLLDSILVRAGLTRDRIPVLEERLRLTQTHVPDNAPDVALELAGVQTRVGVLDGARQTLINALRDTPSHTGLTLLYAELLERGEDWPGLARALEQLAEIHVDPPTRSKWLTRAARVHLEHPVDGGEAMSSARRLLMRACKVSDENVEARSVLLPLAFAEQRWEEVLDLTIHLRAIAGDDDEALLFGALTEAIAQGSRAIARAIGPRHHPLVRHRILWPALARVLEVVATQGPLPRLDAVLGAAGALCGSADDLREQLSAWAVGQPPVAGTSLALARLHEAVGRTELSRHFYQLAAVLARGGPVPAFTERLPEVELPAEPLQRTEWTPREYRGALREILIRLRPFTAGLRGQGGTVAAPTNAIERAALNAAVRPAARWRERFGFLIPLRFTQDELAGGCGARNEAEPTIVVNEEFASAPTPERNYRLAEAATSIALGTAMLTDSHPLPLAGLLDALARIADPSHTPTSRGAQQIGDTLAARGLRAGDLAPELRTALASELEHWLKQPGALAQLGTIIKRACMLMAVRLSGHLDGALWAMARERGILLEDELLDGRTILESPDAQWLLRTLGVIGTGES